MVRALVEVKGARLMREGVRNIEKVLRLADEVDRREGLVAYDRYNDMMSALASHYQYPLRPVVAAFAALSPNNDYKKNLRSLVTVLDAHRRGVRDVSLFSVSTYRACARRALDFLDGVPFLKVTAGEKTRNFYQNILNPDDDYHVTIDGHAISAYVGRRLTMKEAVKQRLPYRQLADDFRLVARRQRLLPCQVQAVAWFVWKRVNKIVYEGTLGFFDDPLDQWRILYPVELIKPFTRAEVVSVERRSAAEPAEVGRLFH